MFIFILEFCLEHISKTILAMVMKFYWWIDLSKGGVRCTGTITLTCLIFELLPFVYFHTEFCLEHISKTILAMVMKFCEWIDLIKGESSAHEP